MVERFNPAPLDKHPEDPKEAAKADREMDGNFMAGLVGTFPASDPVSATQPGTRTGKKISVHLAVGLGRFLGIFRMLVERGWIKFLNHLSLPCLANTPLFESFHRTRRRRDGARR